MSAGDLSRGRLYGIIDLGYVEPAAVNAMAESLIAGGVDLLQLRAKNRPVAEVTRIAAELHQVTSARNVPLIINDFPEVAAAVGAEGVHVGQDDLSVEQARKIAGPNCAVGKSTHSLDQAVRASREGADYIGFGPIFQTPTKPDYVPIGLADIARVQESVRIPIFCIGGIKLHNLPTVLDAGAHRVVIVSGLLRAPDPAEYARCVKKLLTADL